MSFCDSLLLFWEFGPHSNGHDANAKRIWKFNEMDADHVTPWSKGGATDIRNCQMLCRTHNRAKGNR